MSPLLDIQRRFGRELGRIRIGAQIVRGDRKVPTKLETFRFTTPSRPAADMVAELFGGEVHEWLPDGRKVAQWEVMTGVDRLPVAIPPGEPLTQWWELWTGGGCARRCDGQTLTAPRELAGQPCKCPPAGAERAELAKSGNACRPTTRLSVILPDLPDLGVWLLATGGYNAAVELAGTAELLHRAATAGVMLPATLRLEQREVRRVGQPVQHFAVPVLELEVSLRQLVDGTAAKTALPPAPSPARAITSGGTPAPASRPAAPPVDGDDDVVDAEIVDDPERPDPQVLADSALALNATRADVEVLAERSHEYGLDNERVDNGRGSSQPLGALLRARWKELPA